MDAAHNDRANYNCYKDWFSNKLVTSNKDPEQQFMAVQANGNWVVIVHNSGNSLDLPNAKTAEQYHLPKGWFQS